MKDDTESLTSSKRYGGQKMDDELKEIKTAICIIIERIRPDGDFCQFDPNEIKWLREFHDKAVKELHND